MFLWKRKKNENSKMEQPILPLPLCYCDMTYSNTIGNHLDEPVSLEEEELSFSKICVTADGFEKNIFLHFLRDVDDLVRKKYGLHSRWYFDKKSDSDMLSLIRRTHITIIVTVFDSQYEDKIILKEGVVLGLKNMALEREPFAVPRMLADENEVWQGYAYSIFYIDHILKKSFGNGSEWEFEKIPYTPDLIKMDRELKVKIKNSNDSSIKRDFMFDENRLPVLRLLDEDHPEEPTEGRDFTKEASEWLKKSYDYLQKISNDFMNNFFVPIKKLPDDMELINAITNALVMELDCSSTKLTKKGLQVTVL